LLLQPPPQKPQTVFCAANRRWLLEDGESGDRRRRPHEERGTHEQAFGRIHARTHHTTRGAADADGRKKTLSVFQKNIFF
jgi:hypothetical protein